MITVVLVLRHSVEKSPRVHLSRRIDEMFQKLRIQEEGELRELREGLDEVNGWVIVQINDSPTTLASDVDAAFSNK